MMATPPASPSVRSCGNAAGGDDNTMSTMLPGPVSRSNGGCIDLSTSGLLAHGASSIAVVSDPRSMQLLCVLPMPPPPHPRSPPSSPLSAGAPASAPSLAAAYAAAGGEDDHRPLRLATGDRHGRIAVSYARTRVVLHLLSLNKSRSITSDTSGGVQDLCWIHHASRWLLTSIHGPFLLCIWEISNNLA